MEPLAHGAIRFRHRGELRAISRSFKLLLGSGTQLIARWSVASLRHANAYPAAQKHVYIGSSH